MLGRNFLPTERKNFRQFFLHLLRATRVIANPGVIDVHLSFEENSGVFNWIEIRGVRGMGLKTDVILLEGEYELCNVYASVVLLKWRITTEGCLHVLRDILKEPGARWTSVEVGSDGSIRWHRGD